MSAGNSECTADNHSLSTDAVPSSPRHSLDQNTQDEREGQQAGVVARQQVIPDPPSDWMFNVFLNELSEGLTKEDLGTMKFLFEGSGGIGSGILAKIETPLELFRIMRTRRLVSRDNLLYLQAVLFHSKRMDLVTKAVEYSNTIGNVLHFYAPSYLPENGYRHVKFHIDDGHDFKNYTRCDLNQLRSRISTLLFVPEKFINIVGIEPASSLVVTLMIPDMYVSILQELLEDGEQILDIGELGVDIVEIDGVQIYNIKDATAVEEAETEQQSKLVNVYAQLQQTNKRLEDSEDACLDMHREIVSLQQKLKEADASLSVAETQLNTIKKVVSMSSDEPKPATLKELSSLKEFTESLQQVNMDTVNTNVVQRMLNATVSIVSTRFHESHRIQEQRLKLDLQDMLSKLEPMMFELARYKLCIGIINIDKSVLDNIQKLLQSINEPPAVIQTLTDIGLQMLKKISSKLRYKEKEKLKRNFEWSAEGTLENFMEKDPNLFLAGLFQKEIEKTRRPVQFESFISKCLAEVGREELKKYLDIKPYSKKYAEAKQTKEPQQGPQQQQEQTQGIQQQQQQLQEQDDIIRRMAQQVQEMHSIIQSKRDRYESNFNDWNNPSFPFKQQDVFQQQQRVF